MRLSMLVVPLLILAAGATNAHAADEKPFKIGYIDMARALNEVEDGKAAKAKLKTDFDEKQKKLDKMQNDLKAKKEDFDKKAAMMNPDVKAQKQDELQRNFVDLQRTYMELQKELSEREGQLTSEIAEKIRRIIAVIGDRDGYAVILNLGDTVMYYKRHLDLTDDIVREYNRQFAAKK
jgi:outer membrane protein